MKYLKTFEDFSPVSREEKIDILAKTTSYSMEDLQQMSDDELDTLYSGNDAEDTVVPETAEENTPVAAEGASSPGASEEDDNYDMYRADGPMSREELRQMHNTIQEKKKNKGFLAMMDAKKKKEEGKDGKKEDKKDAKKDDKKDDKKPVAKKK